MKAMYPTCQYVDLILINEIVDDDHEMVVQVLNEFIEMTEVDIQRMMDAYSRADLVVVANIAHKFRSSFKYFGVKQYESHPAELEILARGTQNVAAIQPLLDKFVQCCYRMREEIQEVLKHIDPSLTQ